MGERTAKQGERTAKQKAADRRRSEAMRGSNPFGNRGSGGESIVPSKFGAGITTRGAKSLHANIHAAPVLEYNEMELGGILTGMLQALMALVVAAPDFSAMFPPKDLQEHQAEWFVQLAQEREMGKQLALKLRKALEYYKIPQTTWNAFYLALMRGAPGGGAVGPFDVGAAKYRSPLNVAARITAEFREDRPDGPHKGIDIGVPVGTDVVAPTDLKVFDVGNDAEDGNYVQAVGKRRDGQFPTTALGTFGMPGVDDTAYVFKFLHLDAALVSDGQVLTAGDRIGKSGATGHATGPNLHLQVEYVRDRSSLAKAGLDDDERVLVNPLSLIPRELIEAGSQQLVPAQDVLASALIGPLSGGPLQPATVIIANNSVVGIANKGVQAGIAGSAAHVGVLP